MRANFALGRPVGKPPVIVQYIGRPARRPDATHRSGSATLHTVSSTSHVVAWPRRPRHSDASDNSAVRSQNDRTVRYWFEVEFCAAAAGRALSARSASTGSDMDEALAEDCEKVREVMRELISDAPDDIVARRVTPPAPLRAVARGAQIREVSMRALKVLAEINGDRSFDGHIELFAEILASVE